MVESLRGCPDWGQDDLPIEIIRTHISVVLLGKRHVLKLKKPVDLGFLDYTTIEKRRDACRDPGVRRIVLDEKVAPGVLARRLGEARDKLLQEREIRIVGDDAQVNFAHRRSSSTPGTREAAAAR